MILNVMISSNEELLKLKEKTTKNLKYTNYGKNKINFICSKCGLKRTKSINTLKFPFICSNCNNKIAQLKEETKNKIKQTCIERYGYECTAKVPEIRQKQKESFNTHKNNDSNFIKNVVEKREKTYKEKTGYKNPANNPQIQTKIRKTIKEKYGVDYITQNELIKNKIENTKLVKYGNKHYTNRIKSAKTYNEHYKDINEKEKLLNKTKTTNRLKYNCDWSLQNKNIQENQKKHGLIIMV